MATTDIMDDEELWLMILGVMALPTVTGFAVHAWNQGSTWLVEHQILIPASDHPLIAVPTMGGAGLDLARLSIGIGVVILLLVVLVVSARSLVRRQETVR